jgi:2-amino-4-hydroxy-6-hydroxymethyldihydropteridine diphosphokinase
MTALALTVLETGLSDTVYIGLGSNLGDREKHLVGAVEALSRSDAVAVLGKSSLYESAPIGPRQPRFLNAVVRVLCDVTPQRLLTFLKLIELELGRASAPRWGPRVIDLDILLWGGKVIADANLQVPHVELHARRFVLEPLCELDPGAHHPILQVSAQELLSKLAPQDVVRYETAHWHGPDLPSEL